MDRNEQACVVGNSPLPPAVPETPQQRLDRFTPDCLTASQWQAAEPVVRAVVLTCAPVNAEDAKGLASRLCLLLAAATDPAPATSTLPTWDGRTAPDLRALLSEASISAQLERLRTAGKRGKTRENHRADLRRLARATVGLPPRSTRTPVATAATIGPRIPASAQPLLAWLSAGEAPLTALAAYRGSTGRAVTRGLLTPLLPALPSWSLAASAVSAQSGIISGLIAASDPRLDEVSAATWAADSDDLNDRPDQQDRPTRSAADTASTAAPARPPAPAGFPAAPSAAGSTGASTSRTAKVRAARKALTAAVAAAPLPPLELPDNLSPAERKRRLLVHKREHALAVAAALASIFHLGLDLLLRHGV